MRLGSAEAAVNSCGFARVGSGVTEFTLNTGFALVFDRRSLLEIIVCQWIRGSRNSDFVRVGEETFTVPVRTFATIVAFNEVPGFPERFTNAAAVVETPTDVSSDIGGR